MGEERILEGRYRLEKALQSGPLSTTHLATELDSGTRVVIKELAVHAHLASLTAQEGMKRLELLEREAKLLRHLDHPGIPKFIETFRTEEGGRVSLWLVQEYRPGTTLKGMVESGWHGTADEVTRILRRVAEILASLHTRVPPIVHRDVKPANILVDGAEVALVDLGAACSRVLSQRQGSTVVGTPGYVPLEQFAGQAVPASDVYALGMVGVYLVTHEDPLTLTGEDGRVRYRESTSVDHPTLLKTIDRMIEPLASRRLQSMAAVIDSLDGTPEPVAAERRPPSRVVPAAVAIGALGALGVGTALMLSSGGAKSVSDQQAFAAAEEEADPDEAIPQVVPEPAPGGVIGLLSNEPAPELPVRCLVSQGSDVDRPVPCVHYSALTEPVVIGPGRLRAVVDDPADEISGDSELAFTVVDFTPAGIEKVAAFDCPDEGEPVAAALGANGQTMHVACYDGDVAVHLLKVGPGGTFAAGPFELSTSEDFEPYLASATEEPDGGTRAILVAPGRGPALLIFQGEDYEEDYGFVPMVQPLARGARAYRLFPPRLLSEVVSYQIYEHQGRVFAAVRGRRGSDGDPGFFVLQMTSTGSRIVGPLSLPDSQPGEVFCHQLSSALHGEGLTLRAPDEYGDQLQVTRLSGARAFPGPHVGAANEEICGSVEQVFLKRGDVQATVRFENLSTHLHRMSCAGSACVLGFLSSEHGLGIARLKL